MARKQPIHTTLSEEEHKIIERYEDELGGKNEVIGKALTLLGGKQNRNSNHAKHSRRKKISTGLDNLDEMLDGGINKKDIYSINGLPGTGKSTFAIQYLLEGSENTRGILFCEMHIDNVIDRAYALDKGEQLETALNKRTIYIEDRFNGNINEVIEIIEDFGDYKPADRIILDPINTIHDVYNGTNMNTYAWRAFRKIIDGKDTDINTPKTTAMIVNEMTSGNNPNELDYRCDGNIQLSKQYNPENKEYKYFIELSKSGNSTPNYSGLKQVTFTPKGLSITNRPYTNAMQPKKI